MSTLAWVAEWEKACRNMVLGTFRNTADQSVRRVEKGALRMNLWVRQLRGLCLVGVVLAGLLFCAAVGAVATASYAAAQSAGAIVVEGNRRVEAETIRSYFRLNAGRAPRQLQDRPGAQGALCHRPVPGRPHQPVRAAG